jgi:hypothetical protein
MHSFALVQKLSANLSRVSLGILGNVLNNPSLEGFHNRNSLLVSDGKVKNVIPAKLS